MAAAKKSLLLLVLLNGTMFLFGFLENIKGVSYPLIKGEFAVSYEEQGRMVSFLSFSYTFFCVVGGFMLARFGIKKIYLFSFMITLLGLSSIYFMPGFGQVTFSLFFVFSGFGLFEIGVNSLASVIFTEKSALSLNLLHFMYGLGAVAGPRAAGIVSGTAGMNWRYIYLFSIPLLLLMFIPALFTRFPETSAKTGTSEADAPHTGFIGALRTPAVWLFGVTLGTALCVEMASANWGGLYFQDVYGMDPAVQGAVFVSSFFVLFTVSRLVSGFIIEKIGYITSLAGAALCICLVFIAGFALGAKGIFVLPVLGFFIAILWPTIMAVAIGYFGPAAPVMTSAIIAVAGMVNALLQLATGYINSLIGPRWGYRSCLIFAAALIILMFALRKTIRQKSSLTSASKLTP